MSTYKRSRVLSIAAAAVLLAMLIAPLQAQKKTREERREDATTRSVQGFVTDAADQPVAGAVVQVKEMRSLQVRSFITQGDGAYRFSGLKNDNDYQLTAKSGELTAGPKTLSIFDSRKEATINFKFGKK